MIAELLAALPRGWAMPPVYSRFSVQLGKMLDEKRISGTHLAPYLRNVDVQWNHVNTVGLPEMDFSDEDRERYSLRENDLLICEGGEVGRTSIWDGALAECYFQKAIHRLRPLSINDEPRFFRYFMWMAVHSGMFAQTTASTIQHLTSEKLRVVRYPAPPIQRQRAIADYLDRESAVLDSLVAAKERLLDLLVEKRRALITRAVTRGLDTKASFHDSGFAWLGEIPAHWRAARLKFLTTEPLSYGANEAALEDNPNFPRFVRITDLDSAGGLREETFKSLPHEVAEPYLLRQGDVLFARSGATVGKAFIYKTTWGKACFAGYLVRCRCYAKRLLSDFLFAYTQTEAYWGQVGEGTIQATIQNFSAERYANLVLPVPPLVEQHSICAFIAAETAKIDALRSATGRTIALLKERRAALITAAVTGAIDVSEEAA